MVHSGTSLRNARSGQRYFNLVKSVTSDTIMLNLIASDVAINSWLPCRTPLRNQVRIGSVCSFSSLPLTRSWIVRMNWVSQDLLRKPCCESVRVSCSER